MSRFQQQGAVEYDGRIGTLVPGYAALHQTSAAWLKATLPAQARVLLLSSALRPSVRARPARRRAAVRHNRREAAAHPTEAALPRRALRSLWALPRPFPV